jgi:hypothetical protein
MCVYYTWQSPVFQCEESLALSIYYSEHAEGLSVTPVLQLHSDRLTHVGG